MRCLVTGGCGFIGSHLTEALVAAGHEVVVFDNLSSGHIENLSAVAAKVRFVQGDIRDKHALAGAMAGVARVFHEAALVSVFESVSKPHDNHDINVTGTFNVLAAARDAGVRRVVMASTAAVYGNNPELPKREEMLPEPESPYGLGKLAGEYYLSIFARLYGLETVALRYFNVYGPRQDPRSMYSGVISRFVEAIRSGATPVIFGDGQQTRDFVFVKDVVAANLLAADSGKVGAGETINIATGKPTSLLSLLRLLKKVSGRRFKPEFQPLRKGDVRHSAAAIGKARNLLGYRPENTLEAGLRALWQSVEG